MKDKKIILRGEIALIIAIIINSLGVLLMLQSGSGISAISSVPYAFSEVFPVLSLGTWTYIFQGLLVITLMVLKKRFVPSYLFSFVAGFLFGEMMDIHELWITKLPLSIPLRIFYFVLSYIIICFGIALSNRCKLPIIPTDLFPRDLSEIINRPYSKVKITFDVTCLFITACMTYFALGKNPYLICLSFNFSNLLILFTPFSLLFTTLNPLYYSTIFFLKSATLLPELECKP